MGRRANSRRMQMTDVSAANKPSGPDLRFRFSVVGRGWLDADLHASTQHARISASYISDALRLLLIGVSRSSSGGMPTEVRWEEEPGHYLWQLVPRDDQTHLSVLDGRTAQSAERLIFEHRGPTRVVQRAVVDASVQLLVDMGEIRYFQEWGSPFPLDELRSLQRQAGLTPLPERTAETAARLTYPLREQLARLWQDVLRGAVQPDEASAWAKEQMRTASHDEATTRGLQALADLERNSDQRRDRLHHE